jgi:hypothetical protein
MTSSLTPTETDPVVLSETEPGSEDGRSTSTAVAQAGSKAAAPPESVSSSGISYRRQTQQPAELGKAWRIVVEALQRLSRELRLLGVL